MKRFPAPPIRHSEGHGTPYDLKIVRKDPPPHWLLSELLLHTANLCLHAYGEVSARMLLDAALSVPRGGDLKSILYRQDTFYSTAYAAAFNNNQRLHDGFMKAVPEEERASWERMPVVDRIAAYLKRRNDSLPQYGEFIAVGKFLSGEYRHLPDDLRAMTDLVFQGFLFNALNNADFAALCKNKNVAAAPMTFEQKLDEELDREALYNCLLSQLGHA